MVTANKLELQQTHAKIMREARKEIDSNKRTMLYYKAYCIDAKIQGEYPVPFKMYERGI